MIEDKDLDHFYDYDFKRNVSLGLTCEHERELNFIRSADGHAHEAHKACIHPTIGFSWGQI